MKRVGVKPPVDRHGQLGGSLSDTEYFEPVPDGRVKLMGVLIKEDVSAQRPKLISSSNEIVYL